MPARHAAPWEDGRSDRRRTPSAGRKAPLHPRRRRLISPPMHPATGGPRSSRTRGRCQSGPAAGSGERQARSVPEQGGRPDRCGAEPQDRPVDGAVGLGPAALARAEHQLALARVARGTRPSTRTPTSRIRARCSPRRGEQVAPRCGRSPGSRRWPPPSVRDRVIVVKSANRTLQRHRAAGHLGRPHPAGRPWPRAAAARAGSPRGRRCRGRTSRRRPCSCPARRLPRRAVTVRRSSPQASWCSVVGHAPRRPHAAASPAGCARRRRRSCSPSRCSMLGGLLPHPPQLVDVERVQERGDLLAAAPRPRPSGLARRLASLASRDGGGHPDRAGDALLVVDPGAQLLGDGAGEPSRRTDPDTSRNASSSDIASTSGVTCRKVSITDGRHRGERRRSRAGPRPPAGTAARARVIGIAERTPCARAR